MDSFGKPEIGETKNQRGYGLVKCEVIHLDVGAIFSSFT